MTESPETRLFRARWEDGTLDLVAGGAVALIGLGYLFEQMLAPVVALPLAFAAWFILRQRVVEPRAGHVEFANRRRRRSAREAAGAVAAGLGLFVLFLVVAWNLRNPTWRELVDAVPATLVGAAALVAAGLTRAWRFAAYAALLGAAGAATLLLEGGPGEPLLAGGLIVAGAGALLLGRFMVESRPYLEEE